MADYIAGKYYVGNITKDIRAVERALTERFRIVTQITDAAEQKEWNDKIETLSEGKNVVIFDDKDLPSIYFRMPVMTQDQLVHNGSKALFESWIVDNAIISELYVAKYLAHHVTVENAVYPVSLIGLDPSANVNFDTAVANHARKGAGHALSTNANWMQLMLDAYVNSGFQAHGNTNYGNYYYNSKEVGEASYIHEGKSGRTKTGSGPNTWSHDGTPFGVFDMVGNVWEWNGGYRVATGGEINVLPNNDAMNSANSQSASSDKWKGIKAEDGSYQAVGAEGNLFYDCGGSKLELTDSTNKSGTNGSKDIDFKALTAKGITIPNIAIRLGIAPVDTSVQGHVWCNTSQEDLLLRGGAFHDPTYASSFASFLSNPRAASTLNFGSRGAVYRK